MSFATRQALMAEIARRRESKVIAYITGDRENVNTRIAPDVLPVFYRHLKSLPTIKRLDLFLYSRGGDVLTPWRLVHLIREFAPEFAVLVPFRAYSAGTLVCLGADELVMGAMGELGPIDPAVVNAFNPKDPLNPAAKLPVSVEDVYSFLALAREVAGLEKEDDRCKAFLLLAEKIHPLALGNVHRNYLLVRSLATKLLSLRRNPPPPQQVRHIVDSLTEKLYAHNHMIPRWEAAVEIGLSVTYPDPELETLLWRMFEDYQQELLLDQPFNPVETVRGFPVDFEVAGGLVESEAGQEAYLFSGVMDQRDPDGQVNVNILRQGWRRISGGVV
jgi:hypothetical protein